MLMKSKTIEEARRVILKYIMSADAQIDAHGSVNKKERACVHIARCNTAVSRKI